MKKSDKITWDILIVDNDSELRRLITEIISDFVFQDLPMKVSEAGSAEEAKDILNNNTIDITFIDISMETKVAGLDLTKYIREDLQNKIIQIIIVTGHYTVLPEFKVVKEYDINDYVMKSTMDFNSRILVSLASSLREYSKDLDMVNTLDDYKSLKNFPDMIGDSLSVDSIINAMFQYICNSYSVECAAVFYESRLLKTCQKKDKSKYIAVFKKWKTNEGIIERDGFLFIQIREFENYVFIIKSKEHDYIENIINHGVLIRKNLIKVVRDKKLLKALCFLSNKNVLYLMARSDKSLVVSIDEAREIDLPLKEVFLFFDNENFLRVHKSIAVNPVMIIDYELRDYRTMSLTLLNKHEITVSARRVKTVMKYIKENLKYL